MAHVKTSKPINRDRPYVVRVSVTAAERKALRMAALKADVSMSRYVRAQALAAMRKGLSVEEP